MVLNKIRLYPSNFIDDNLTLPPPHTPGKFQTARQTMFNTEVTTFKKSKQKYVVNCCKTENLIRGD